MAEDKTLGSLNYKSLNFTDAEYEKALKMTNKPESANQILLALLDVSSHGGDTSNDEAVSATNTTTCCTNNSSISSQAGAEDKTGFLISFQDKQELASSGYSSSISFASSTNQSLENLHHSPALRKIFVDGSNVARKHSKDGSFSWTGIQICVQWFHSRHHTVKVFVPEERCKSADDNVLAYLNGLNALIRTPDGCNDDLFVIEAARQNNGVIVSNDQFREEKGFDNELRRFIDLNRLPYVFVDDQFIPVKDLRGRSGPSMLSDFLKDLPETGYHNKLPRQRYQRNGISRMQSHNTGGGSSKSRQNPTKSLSLPERFR